VTGNSPTVSRIAAPSARWALALTFLSVAVGFDMQIAGHSHGGQFWPWNWRVRYFPPFASRLIRLVAV
jgi:hypothetical protein